MNIRDHLAIQDDYAAFNREERNLAAIFYHALHLGSNLESFLERAGCRLPTDPTTPPPVYFEFAYLRDAWSLIDDNDTKRDLILRSLPISSAGLLNSSIEEFNQFFVTARRTSRTDIQQPGSWSISVFDGHIAENRAFLAACRFKWAFKAKPDIVIQTAHERCVCIEAKLESGEGSYPTSKEEKAIFRRRGLLPVSQTDLQREMLTALLGMETDFVFLAAKRPSGKTAHRFVTWTEAFDAMDRDALPPYMQSTIDFATQRVHSARG